MLGEDTLRDGFVFGSTDAEAQASAQEEQRLVRQSEEQSQEAFIRQKIADVRRWRTKYKDDFSRMRENMAFVTGIQRDEQTKIGEDKRYIANFCNQLIVQKVSRLYARNPQFVAQRRKRRDFVIWDGNPESIVKAAIQIEQAQMFGAPPPMDAWALMADYEQGSEWREHVKNVGETLEVLYQYQCDSLEPDFKTQMKNLVQRVSVCGVGYVRLSFCRNYQRELTMSETKTNISDRAIMAQGILESLKDGSIQDYDAKMEQLRILLEGIEASVVNGEQLDVSERLVFDFLPSTSIIPDDNTRCLIGWVGTQEIAQEFILPLKFVNDYFELRGDREILAGADVVEYSDKDAVEVPKNSTDVADGTKQQLVCIWDVINKESKSHYIICDGWNKGYVQDPEPLTPNIRRFWPIFPLCFNKAETERGSKASIFPPSDVDQLKSAQRAWNQRREALDDHRKANKPQYITAKGSLSDEDKDRVEQTEPNAVIELANVPPGTDPDTVFKPKTKVPIDPAVYDTAPLSEDTLITTGTQEANLGPVQPNTTATGNTIAEQSRMSSLGSNVDDIDDFLSALGESGGEMLLQEMSPEVVIRIVGRGAVWPSDPKDRADYLNEILLQVRAASSGRPNQALAVANIKELAPLILQAGGNPQTVIRELAKRLDDTLEPAEFFPLPGAVANPIAASAGAPTGPQPANSAKPLPQLSAGAPVPLVGA